MFRSRTYIDGTYNAHNLYQYEIIDSELVSITTILSLRYISIFASLEPLRATAAIIKEYESRNYDHQEIVKNLFLLNMFLKQKYVFNLNKILKYQFKFSNKKLFNKMCFNKYYDDLIKYIKKMKILC